MRGFKGTPSGRPYVCVGATTHSLFLSTPPGRPYVGLETFMGVDQRTGEGSKPCIPCVVSKSDRDHGTATTDNRNLGLTPTVTISRSNLSLSLYPIRRCDHTLSGPLNTSWSPLFCNRCDCMLSIVHERMGN